MLSGHVQIHGNVGEIAQVYVTVKNERILSGGVHPELFKVKPIVPEAQGVIVQSEVKSVHIGINMSIVKHKTAVQPWLVERSVYVYHSVAHTAQHHVCSGHESVDEFQREIGQLCRSVKNTSVFFTVNAFCQQCVFAVACDEHACLMFVTFGQINDVGPDVTQSYTFVRQFGCLYTSCGSQFFSDAAYMKVGFQHTTDLWHVGNGFGKFIQIDMNE